MVVVVAVDVAVEVATDVDVAVVVDVNVEVAVDGGAVVWLQAPRTSDEIRTRKINEISSLFMITS